MMEGFKDIWRVLKGLFGYVLALLVLLPLMLVSELVCIPECVTEWLWKMTLRMISVSKEEEG